MLPPVAAALYGQGVIRSPPTVARAVADWVPGTGASGIPFQTRLRGTVVRWRNPYLILALYFNLWLNIRASLLPEPPF